MLRILRRATVNNYYCYENLQNMANLPPRKNSTSSKTSKQDSSPLQILLQMGFTKHRALKALAATGNRSVQLASDWLLTHVNDAFLDEDDPREYILYANPTGPLLTQLLEFWEKSKIIGWNGAHNCPPHITLVPFFKAPNEKSLQLAKAVKPVVEKAGDPPVSSPLWEQYVSPNFMGLFLSEEHSDYLSCIAAEYIKHVSAGSSISLESHVKSLHITLAYHFEDAAFDSLKKLVEELQPAEMSNWELRLYSRDPRFVNHQVYKVTQGYEPKASDELELVLGDYIYVEQKELDNSPDGWVHGTSWLTGVSGYLPAVYTTRTAESDAWTLHRAMSLTSNMNSDKSESDSATETEGETTAVSAHDVQFARDQSEQTYREWHQYWNHVQLHKSLSFLDVTNGTTCDWKMNTHTNGDSEKRTIDQEVKSGVSNGTKGDRRWILSMRHGERVDLTYGQWVPYCFDKSGTYQRKDLNMPLTLPERAGGAERFGRDTPLTRVGRLQAWLVGEALRLARVPLRHVYCSPALRCIETAQAMLQGFEADKAIAIRVEPGLFEFKKWHMAKGMVPFMTLNELHRAGFNVDLSYKPYVDLDVTISEELDEWYERSEKVFQSAVKDTSAEGGNIMFVGHAATLDLMVSTLKRLDADPNETPAPYQFNKHLDRVPYCALAAMQDQPFQLVCPPVPPSINSSSGRFDWKMLLDF